MAELTIQIPDELAARLEPLRERLPELLAQLLENTSKSASTLLERTASTTEPPSVYAEVLDFLLQPPTNS